MGLAIATLFVLAWGVLAFGAVYPWAFTVLAIGCSAVGLAGLATGKRRFADSAILLWTVIAIGGVALLQQVPLPTPLLAAVSPGTLRFLSQYDFRYQIAAGPPHAVSLSPLDTWVALMLLGAFILLLAGLLRALSSGALLAVARGIVVLGALVAFVGIAQYAMLGDHAFAGMRIYGFWQPESRLSTPFGPFVNKNHFAGWMVMALPLALGLAVAECEAVYRRGARGRDWIAWLSTPRGGRSLLILFAALWMALAAVMTRSRSGLGCLAVIAVLFCVAVARRMQSRRVGGAALVTAVALAALVVLTAGRESALTQTRIVASPLAMRLDVWRMSASILHDFPVVGTGLNTFGTATILYQQSGGLHYFEAHNDYVQLAVEGGAVMSMLAFAAIAALAVAIWRRFRADQIEAELYWIRAGATIGLIAVGLQALVEFGLQMPGNAALFTVLVVIALYSPRQSPHARR